MLWLKRKQLVLEFYLAKCFFCAFVPSFIWSSMWGKENFSIWSLLEKRNFHSLPSPLSPLGQEFQTVSMGGWFYSELGRSQPPARTTKGKIFLPAGSGLRCFTRKAHVRNLLCCCFFWGLLWSVKTFSTKFKGSLLVHCIICVKCPKNLNSSVPFPEQTDKQTGSFRLWFWNNAFHWSFKKKSNPAQFLLFLAVIKAYSNTHSPFDVSFKREMVL